MWWNSNQHQTLAMFENKDLDLVNAAKLATSKQCDEAEEPEP